jgi:hypothetical protein
MVVEHWVVACHERKRGKKYVSHGPMEKKKKVVGMVRATNSSTPALPFSWM